jgi:hypothetical protein
MVAFLDPWRGAAVLGGEGHAPVVAVLLACAKARVPPGSSRSHNPRNPSSPRLPPVAITARRRGLGRQKAQGGFDGSFPAKLVPGRSSQGRPVTGQGGKQCKSDSLRSRP